MVKKETEHLYSSEISLVSSPELEDYILLNLRKVQEYRRQFNIPVIGIAGAEGKTTTKRMISAILRKRGPVLETPLDCHTASTVTSTLMRLADHYRYALLELGIINKDQFRLAAEISEPTIGVITNIGEAHMPGLGDKYLIADAKMELVRRLPKNGFAVLNIDDELVSGMEAFSSTPQVIKFGLNTNAHFYANRINYLGPEGMEFYVNQFYRFQLPIYSSASVYNALAAIAVGRILQFDFEEIQEALRNDFQLLPGRGELIDLGDIFILNHTYNATINAVTKACESLIQFKKFSKKLMLVLGGMEGLEKYSEKVHLNLGYYLSALPIDIIVTVGEDAHLVGKGIRQINHTKKIIHQCDDVSALADTVYRFLEPHTTVLMIGGKSLKLQDQLSLLTDKIKTHV